MSKFVKLTTKSPRKALKLSSWARHLEPIHKLGYAAFVESAATTFCSPSSPITEKPSSARSDHSCRHARSLLNPPAKKSVTVFFECPSHNLIRSSGTRARRNVSVTYFPNCVSAARNGALETLMSPE